MEKIITSIVFLRYSENMHHNHSYIIIIIIIIIIIFWNWYSQSYDGPSSKDAVCIFEQNL